MKIILSGDLHLGRTSTRLPDEWRPACRTVQAWRRLVDHILSEQADLLVLSGDLLDHRNQLWEAMAPLQEGIRKLADAGIRTLAVSGNHDAASLPELTRQFPEEAFTLIGQHGKWERKTLSRDGSPLLHIDGWCFPAEKVKTDPTLEYALPSPTDGNPVLAVVHGDPGVAESSYAPLSISRLQQLPVSAWLLGHIHRPQFTPGSPWVLMPGSPHPMDPGEPDAHHAWICTLENGRLSEPAPFCPAILRYSELPVPVTVDEVPGADRLREKIQREVGGLGFSGRMSLRLRISGVSRDIDRWREAAEGLEDWAAENFRIDKIHWDLHPDLNLEDLKKAGPVPALLADMLETPPPELRKRLEELCRDLDHHRVYSGKGLPPCNAEDIPLRGLTEECLRKAVEQLT